MWLATVCVGVGLLWWWWRHEGASPSHAVIGQWRRLQQRPELAAPPLASPRIVSPAKKVAAAAAAPLPHLDFGEALPRPHGARDSNPAVVPSASRVFQSPPPPATIALSPSHPSSSAGRWGLSAVKRFRERNSAIAADVSISGPVGTLAFPDEAKAFPVLSSPLPPPPVKRIPKSIKKKVREGLVAAEVPGVSFPRARVCVRLCLRMRRRKHCPGLTSWPRPLMISKWMPCIHSHGNRQ